MPVFFYPQRSLMNSWQSSQDTPRPKDSFSPLKRLGLFSMTACHCCLSDEMDPKVRTLCQRDPVNDFFHHPVRLLLWIPIVNVPGGIQTNFIPRLSVTLLPTSVSVQATAIPRCRPLPHHGPGLYLGLAHHLTHSIDS